MKFWQNVGISDVLIPLDYNLNVSPYSKVQWKVFVKSFETKGKTQNGKKHHAFQTVLLQW